MAAFLLMSLMRASRVPYALSFLAGAVASLSLPPFYFAGAFLAFGYVMYQTAIARHWRIAALHSGLGAYGWFASSLYWISHSLLVGEAEFWFLLPVSLLGIPILVTVFWIAGAFIAYGSMKHPAARLVMLVAMLGLAEWSREFIATGFPWNAPGLIFLSFDHSAYLAAYIGQAGLSLCAFGMAAIVPFWQLSHGPHARTALVVIVFAAVAIGSGASLYHDRLVVQGGKGGAMVRLVQPDIQQDEKWHYEKRAGHLAKLVALSKMPSDEVIDLVIWPESAFAGDYGRERALLHDIKDQFAADLLTGVLRFDETGRLFNSAIMMKHDSLSVPIYDKTHLVPFGEYVPWRFLPFVDAIAGARDFTAGDQVTPFHTHKTGILLPLICYEAIFPALTGRATQRPDVIVNLTNDGWFGHTTGPHQHLAQTRMTAISYGIPLVRVANGGISAVFDAKGHMLAQLGLGASGVIDHPLPAPLGPTIFARFGMLGMVIISLVLVVGAYGLDRKSQKGQ